VIALPPSLAGAEKLTVIGPVDVVVEPDTACAFVGAPGAVGTVTAFDPLDAALLPTAFVAATVHVYVLPALKDATEIGVVDPELDRVVPPSVDVHVAV
jgi:hypothetical protein